MQEAAAAAAAARADDDSNASWTDAGIGSGAFEDESNCASGRYGTAPTVDSECHHRYVISSIIGCTHDTRKEGSLAQMLVCAAPGNSCVRCTSRLHVARYAPATDDKTPASWPAGETQTQRRLPEAVPVSSAFSFNLNATYILDATKETTVTG